LDILIVKKASILGMDVVEVNKELKIHDIVKVEKGIKEESEPTLVSFGKAGEISPWIEKQMKLLSWCMLLQMSWRLQN
jgi:hypothetical protein